MSARLRLIPCLLETRDCSGTKCPFDLKPGCKFKFVRCLESYLNELISLGHDGTLQDTFLPRVGVDV